MRERARVEDRLRDRGRGARDLGLPALRLPAGVDEQNPPPAPRTEPYKTHLAYVRERRSDADGDALLEEALTRLRARRGA